MDPRAACTDPQKFWDRVIVSEGCWLWTGALQHEGYGLLAVYPHGTSTTIGAHRLSYELLVGPIPEGLTIDHLCRVRDCVRPDHLEPVTASENIRRAWVARGWSPTRCMHGHDRNHPAWCIECREARRAAHRAELAARAAENADYFRRLAS